MYCHDDRIVIERIVHAPHHITIWNDLLIFKQLTTENLYTDR